MAGHSKWANIRHRKERADLKKGKVFSRIAKEIISAVKQGGPDPKTNPKLRLAMQKAKTANLPNDSVERNIKKASHPDQSDFVAVVYELYGYGGVGILVEAMTDNKNRTASDIRIATNKRGGSIANMGAVAFNFDRKGVIQVARQNIEEDSLFLLASEAGAEDFVSLEDMYVITTSADTLYAIKATFEHHHVVCSEAEWAMLPKVYVECNQEMALANLALIEWLEGIDDVDAVYHNMQSLPIPS